MMAIASRRSRGRFLVSLLIGDAVVVTLFVAVGMTQHQTIAGLGSVIVTATPFLISWIAVGLWLGVFWERAIARPVVAARSILFPWVLTVPIAMQLRTLLLGRGASIAFAAVVFVIGGLFFILWRSVYALFHRKFNRS